MTKSKYRKKKDLEGRLKGYVSAGRFLAEADKGFLFEDSKRIEMLRRCHKNTVLYPGNIEEGDTVCLVRMKPKKVRRRKNKCSTWKVQYFDRGNGFIQLGNDDMFDKKGAEENTSFLRTHHFDITEVWNLDSAFTLFFLPRLKVFINSTRYGVPGNIYHQYIEENYSEKEASELAEKEWEDILKRLYEGLTLAYEGEDAEEIRTRLKKEHGLTNQTQLWEIEREMEADAQKLFGKYFFNLWD